MQVLEVSLQLLGQLTRPLRHVRGPLGGVLLCDLATSIPVRPLPGVPRIVVVPALATGLVDQARRPFADVGLDVLTVDRSLREVDSPVGIHRQPTPIVVRLLAVGSRLLDQAGHPLLNITVVVLATFVAAVLVGPTRAACGTVRRLARQPLPKLGGQLVAIMRSVFCKLRRPPARLIGSLLRELGFEIVVPRRTRVGEIIRVVPDVVRLLGLTIAVIAHR
ncbi:hypothetical protein [Pseudonocardia sp. TRM90224]|uniref:hypothetical protein n=1 Tax=Pseudonocardia sp. TRM90224 TaxID=2812678 RepID=UPI001E34750B|nr:hypothetical protein [Pseudonocardia sp. TRM90224]